MLKNISSLLTHRYPMLLPFMVICSPKGVWTPSLKWKKLFIVGAFENLYLMEAFMWFIIYRFWSDVPLIPEMQNGFKKRIPSFHSMSVHFTNLIHLAGLSSHLPCSRRWRTVILQTLYSNHCHMLLLRSVYHLLSVSFLL